MKLIIYNQNFFDRSQNIWKKIKCTGKYFDLKFVQCLAKKQGIFYLEKHYSKKGLLIVGRRKVEAVKKPF